MRQFVVQAGSGAQGSNKKVEDEALHATLAKANLMRLRGDYAEAEKTCVSLLAAYPGNAAVHTLLGDIAFSQDKAEQAIQHYEIAEGLDPEAQDIPRKLQDARDLKASHETFTTAEQLGLPTRSPVPWTAIGFGAFAALAIGACVVITLAVAPRRAALPPSAPIVATSAMTMTPKGGKGTEETAPKTPAVATESKPPESSPAPSVGPGAGVGGGALEDQNLFETIQGKSGYGSHLLTLNSDPRGHVVTLSFSYGADEDARRIGAQLAKDTLEQNGDTLSVTIRGIRDQRLEFVADVPRTKYADTITDTWKSANPETDSWIAYVLTNEWPYRSAETTKAP